MDTDVRYIPRRGSLARRAIELGIVVGTPATPAEPAERKDESDTHADLVGLRTGKLTVTRLLERRHPGANSIWEVVCECGSTDYRKQGFLISSLDMKNFVPSCKACRPV